MDRIVEAAPITEGGRRARRVAAAFEVAAARMAVRLLRRLGPVRASNLMGGLFRAIGPHLPVTSVAETNLRLTLPELAKDERRRVIRGMWESLGRTIGEFPHLGRLPQNSASGPGWEMVREERLIEQAKAGGPAIFVSGHIGNWEMLPAAVAAYGMPVASVYRPAGNPALDETIRELREAAIGRAVPAFAKGARGAREAMAHMRGGGFLGLLVDQKMNDGIEARLFGRPAMTAPALAAFALRFRCPVICGHVQRVGPARFRLVVDDPLELPDSGDRQADILALTQAVNDRLERWIRARPESWLWLHRRFEKPLYRRR